VLALFDFPIKRAIGAGALSNLVVALPATVTFLPLAWGTAGQPTPWATCRFSVRRRWLRPRSLSRLSPPAGRCGRR
jgi:hypothetical protein